MIGIHLAHAAGSDWASLGAALRASALDAHDGVLPDVDFAYQFLLDSPECFSGGDEWPPDMPADPPLDLIVAYFGWAGEQEAVR